MLVVDPGHRFCELPVIEVGELATERLILFDRTSSYFVLTSAFFREAGIVPRGVMELDNVDATKKMVEHGLGIAFLPYTAVRGELAAGTLQEVAIAGYEPVRRSIVAIRRRDAIVPGGSDRRAARRRPARRARAQPPGLAGGRGRREHEQGLAVRPGLELVGVDPRLRQPDDVGKLCVRQAPDGRAAARAASAGSACPARRARSSRRRKTLPFDSPFGVGGMNTTTESASSTYLNV